VSKNAGEFLGVMIVKRSNVAAPGQGPLWTDRGTE